MTRRLPDGMTTDEMIAAMSAQPERSQHDLLVSIQMELERQTALLHKLLSAFGELANMVEELGAADGERQASVWLEDRVKGPPMVGTKSYTHSPLTRDQVNQHMDAHAHAHREAERRALEGWAATTDALAETC